MLSEKFQARQEVKITRSQHNRHLPENGREGLTGIVASDECQTILKGRVAIWIGPILGSVPEEDLELISPAINLFEIWGLFTACL